MGNPIVLCNLVIAADALANTMAAVAFGDLPGNSLRG